ncbi:MAG: peptidylprolyl isomerase [Defluviitaleaceae bacterium]|nr:peptidylprolyl isomerase [Defluviitaleaceae bacterium]
MTKKKSALFQVLFLLGMCGVLIGVLMLTGCSGNDSASEQQVELGQSQPLETADFDGGAYFVTSDVGNMTNQELFDLILETPNAVFGLMNLIDEVLLRGNIEMDEANTVGVLEELKADIPDFESWMIQFGFESEADVLHRLELQELRLASVRHLINVTNEEVQAMFDEWFDPEEADFDELREEIYDFLVSEAINEVIFEALARLRYEAGLEIFNHILEAAYEEYLATALLDIETHAASTPPSADVVARVNGVDITMGQLFHALSTELGLEMAFHELDEKIIAQTSIEALLEPTDERLREIYDALGPTVSGSHILVEDYEFAAALIEQLQDANDFQALFAELAYTYSICPSAAEGGDLGSWEICSVPGVGCMVAEFDEAVVALEVGEFTDEPVETEFGFHIIYKTGAEDVPEFEDIRDELKEQEIAGLMQMPHVMNELLMNLREEAGVVFTNPTLQARFQYFVAAQQ